MTTLTQLQSLQQDRAYVRQIMTRTDALCRNQTKETKEQAFQTFLAATNTLEHLDELIKLIECESKDQ